jgi:peptide/nickel transport system ATP-binding protein
MSEQTGTRGGILHDIFGNDIVKNDIIIEAKELRTEFPVRSGLFGRTSGVIRAVDGVSLSIARGTTLGLVGESGCGKTTLGKTLLRLCEKTSGEVLFEGKDVFALNRAELRQLRPKMQIVFQDPFASLSPRMPIGEIIGEAVREHSIVERTAYNAYIDRVMQSCGLQPEQKNRYPHEFSGGQRQRIAIARALALQPKFVVCDEPVSALDGSVQAQILNLLSNLQTEFGLTYLFISHDLSVVEHVADTLAVMYLGQIVEYGAARDVFEHPLHPYTRALFSAIPSLDPAGRSKRILLEGGLPSPANPPNGCRFHPRCNDCMPICRRESPACFDAGGGHTTGCHLYGGADR